jgi:ActR/RegA family two-component response regulator
MSTTRPSLFGIYVVLVGSGAEVEAWRRALKARGAIVSLVRSLGQAAELFRRVAPHVLVVDFTTMAETADELIPSMRSLARAHGRRLDVVVILQAGDDVNPAVTAAGFQKCLTKPVDVATLCQAVSEVRLRRLGP